jgi:uncharacterized membrane protein YjjP (DUF1212 family)
MQTIYDWVTVALFGGLAVLFLDRSVGRRVPGDHVLAYLPAAAGCAVANVLGNQGRHAAAIAVIAATIAYILWRLRPWRRG